jgi:16S rRNA (cytosine1402-N4)-methyltransferase
MRLHEPVLLSEAIASLDCRSEGLYVDCTLGMGGHSEAILKATEPGGRLLAFDRDQDAIDFSKQRLSAYADRVELVQDDYRNLKQALAARSLPPAAGILVDFGPSMLQFSTAERGFSFQQEGPLDMRMDRSASSAEPTAADLVNQSSFDDLRRILRTYGEETAASKIAKRIVETRAERPISTTTQLREIVESVAPRKRDQKIHPATKTFQALRIAVNHELENLDQFLFDAFDALQIHGRLVVISFHSLEDRVAKQIFQFLSAACRCSKKMIVCHCGGKPLSRPVTRKPVTPGPEEIKKNPASRSAKLRAIEKIDAAPAPRKLWEQWLQERG